MDSSTTDHPFHTTPDFSAPNVSIYDAREHLEHRITELARTSRQPLTSCWF